MKKSCTLLTALAMVSMVNAQTTHELTNVGTTFSPAVITMIPGDDIHLVLAAPHTCTQVDEATWNADGNTSNGGFNYSSGETTFSLSTPGTYYYVCTPHASMGMKGKIIVESGMGVQEQAADAVLRLFPNPANSSVRIPGLAVGQRVQVLDMTGKVVLEALPTEDGTVDISSLGTGNYSVVARDAKGNPTATERLVIAR